MDALVLVEGEQVMIPGYNSRGASHHGTFHEFIIVRIVGNHMEIASNLHAIGHALQIV